MACQQEERQREREDGRNAAKTSERNEINIVEINKVADYLWEPRERSVAPYCATRIGWGELEKLTRWSIDPDGEMTTTIEQRRVRIQLLEFVAFFRSFLG